MHPATPRIMITQQCERFMSRVPCATPTENQPTCIAAREPGTAFEAAGSTVAQGRVALSKGQKLAVGLLAQHEAGPQVVVSWEPSHGL